MRKFLGIAGEFNSNIVFEPIVTTRNLYIDKILNVLSTRKGERPMRPDFGCILWDYLFENIHEEDLFDLEENLKIDLNRQLQPILIEYIKIELNDNTVEVSLRFISPEDSQGTSMSVTLI